MNLVIMHIVLMGVGCSDQGLKPCHDEIDIGITTPTPNEILAYGYNLSLKANVNNICGGTVLEEAMYSLSSDVDGNLAGEGFYEDDEFIFETENPLNIAEHNLTLRVVAGGGGRAEDEISIQVIPNAPPTVQLLQPTQGTEVWAIAEGAEIIAQVADEHDAMEDLTLAWTLNGTPLEGAPIHPDADGMAQFLLDDTAAGCHNIAVTVYDKIDQSAADHHDFLLYEVEEELDQYRWWLDQDGDGWGVEASEIISCEQPPDTILFTGMEDCDDSNIDVHPGAADYCKDGIDSDCDPLTPVGCFPYGDVDVFTADASLYGDFVDISNLGDFNNDGHNDLAVGSRDFYAYFINGPLFGTIHPEPNWTSNQTGEILSMRGVLGHSIDGGKDINGDGISDLLFGNPDWRYACNGNYSISTGKAYTMFGSTDLEPITMEEKSQPGSLVGAGDTMVFHTEISGCPSVQSRVGHDVILLEDMDGDGHADFAFSSNRHHEDALGEVWILLSTDIENMDGGTLDSNDYRLRIKGVDSEQNLGQALASADVDGDGLSDLIISATDYNNEGKVFVVFASDMPPISSDIEITGIAGITFTGSETGSNAGQSIAGVGDLDGDGDEEFLISAPGEEGGAGVVYLVPGFYAVNGMYTLGEELPSSSSPNALAPVQFIGNPNDGLNSVAAAGDINNDGYTDLVFGAPGHSIPYLYTGATYIVYGGPNYWGHWWDPSSGEAHTDIYLLESAEASQNTAVIRGTGTDMNGMVVIGAGDMNDDGYDDIAILGNPLGAFLRIFFGGGT